MTKTVHTTGPDHRNQGAGQPTAPESEPAERPDSVETSDPGARSGAATRVDMQQAGNENAGDAWMEAEERAAAGATRGRR